MTLFGRWREWWRRFIRVRKVSRGLPWRERRRLGKLAISGQHIDPKDAEAVRAMVEFFAISPFRGRTLNMGLVAAILIGALTTLSGLLREEWGLVALGAVLLVLMPLVDVMDRRIRLRYRRTAEANGWSVE